MASITHSTRTKPTPYRKRNGTFDLREFQPSTGISTATITYGDVVQFDVNVASANHRIVKSSTMATVPDVLSTAFLGIAMEDDSVTIGQTVRSHKVLVCMADKDTEFKWPTKLSGTAHASSIVGLRASVGYDSTLGMFYANPAGAASTAGDGSLIVTEVIDAGTTNGYVAAKFLSTAVARLISAAY